MKGTNKTLEFYANQKNWPKTLDEAKAFAHIAIDEWNFKDKAPRFHQEIDSATSVKRIQELVIYPMLSGEGIGVIKK